jgi:hypothetical protein
MAVDNENKLVTYGEFMNNWSFLANDLDISLEKLTEHFIFAVNGVKESPIKLSEIPCPKKKYMEYNDADECYYWGLYTYIDDGAKIIKFFNDLHDEYNDSSTELSVYGQYESDSLLSYPASELLINLNNETGVGCPQKNSRTELIYRFFKDITIDLNLNFSECYEDLIKLGVRKIAIYFWDDEGAFYNDTQFQINDEIYYSISRPLVTPYDIWLNYEIYFLDDSNNNVDLGSFINIENSVINGTIVRDSVYDRYIFCYFDITTNKAPKFYEKITSDITLVKASTVTVTFTLPTGTIDMYSNSKNGKITFNCSKLSVDNDNAVLVDSGGNFLTNIGEAITHIDGNTYSFTIPQEFFTEYEYEYDEDYSIYIPCVYTHNSSIESKFYLPLCDFRDINKYVSNQNVSMQLKANSIIITTFNGTYNQGYNVTYCDVMNDFGEYISEGNGNTFTLRMYFENYTSDYHHVYYYSSSFGNGWGCDLDRETITKVSFNGYSDRIPIDVTRIDVSVSS